MDNLKVAPEAPRTHSKNKAPPGWGKGGNSENVDIANLNCPEWLKQALRSLDTDGDGLEREEVEEMLDFLAKQKAATKQNVTELDYTKFPPKVQEVLSGWDEDKSGSVSMQELLKAAKAQEKMNQANRLFKVMLLGAILIIFVLIITNFVTSLLAQEAAKDFRPNKKSSSRRLESSYTEKNRRLDVPLRASLAQLPELNTRELGGHAMSTPEPGKKPAPSSQATCTENSDGDEECGIIGPGQMTTDDGLRAGAAQAGLEYFGCEVFTSIFELPPTDLPNILSFSVPLSTGCASFTNFQECDVNENEMGRVVACKSFDPKKPAKGQEKKPTIINWVRNETAQVVFIKHPTGFKEKAKDFCKQGTRELTAAADDILTSNCPSGPGGCQPCEAKLKIKVGSADAPRVQTTIVEKGDYCGIDMSDPKAMPDPLGCAKNKYKDYLIAMGAPDDATITTHLDALDCNSDGFISESEEINAGRCFDDLVTQMLTNGTHPEQKRIRRRRALREERENIYGRRLLGLDDKQDTEHNRKLSVKNYDQHSFVDHKDDEKTKRHGRYLSGDGNLRRMTVTAEEETVILCSAVDCGKLPVETMEANLMYDNLYEGALKSTEKSKKKVKQVLKNCNSKGDGALTEEDTACVYKTLKPTEENMEKTEEPAAEGLGQPKDLGMIPSGGGVAAASSPDDLMLPGIKAGSVSREQKTEQFTTMDINGDGFVDENEQANSEGRLAVDSFNQNLLQLGLDQGVVGPEEFALAAKNQPDGEIAECFFPVKDENMDRLVDQNEFTKPDVETFLNANDKCGGRILLEKLVYEPRRQRRQRRLKRREANLRRRMQSRFGGHYTTGYVDWLDDRQKRARRVLESHTRQLGEVTERLRRRSLEEYEAKKLRALSGAVTVAFTTEAPLTAAEVEAEITTYPTAADFAAAVDAEILDDMAENLSGFTKNETLSIIDDLLSVASNMTCIDPVRILSDPLSHTDSDSDWFSTGGHRHLLAVHHRKLATTLTQNEKDSLKCCAGSPEKLKMCMNKLAPTIDEEAQKVLEAQTGGIILTPFQAANSDAADLTEVKSPLQETARRQRLLRRRIRQRRIRVLSVKEDDASKADKDVNGNASGRRRLSHHEGARLLEERLLAGCASQDADLEAQVLADDEVTALAAMFQIEPLQQDIHCSKAKKMNQEMAVKRQMCENRVLKEFEIHEEDMTEIHRMLDEATLAVEGEMMPCMMTACQVMEMIDPVSATHLAANETAMAHFEEGNTEYCVEIEKADRAADMNKLMRRLSQSRVPAVQQFVADRERRMAERELSVEWANPQASAIPMESVEKTSGGGFVKKPNPEPTTFAQFALHEIEKIDTFAPCAELPLAEKHLSLNNDTKNFDPTSDYYVNTQSHEMGPGCLKECNCIIEDPMNPGFQMFNCTHVDYEVCPCMRKKAECLHMIVDSWLNRGGEVDPTKEAEDLKAEATKKGSGRRQRRMLRAKSLFKRRMARNNVRKLLPYHAKQVHFNIAVEKERRRRIRRQIRRLQQAVKDTQEEITKDENKKDATQKRHLSEKLDEKKRRLKDFMKDLPDDVKDYFAKDYVEEKICGDDPKEICECDPKVDKEACVGGMAYPAAVAANVKDGYKNPMEIVHPCADFTRIEEIFNRAIYSFEGNSTMTVEEQDIHTTALDHALTATGIDTSLLTHEMQGVLEEEVMKPCVSDSDMEDFLIGKTEELHKPDLSEMEAMCADGVTKCKLPAGQVTQKPLWDKAMSLGTKPAKADKGDDVEQKDEIGPEELATMVEKCDDSSTASPKTECAQIKTIAENINNACPNGEMTLTVDDLNDFADPAGGGGSDNVNPDPEGYITVAKCALETSMSEGLDKAGSMEKCNSMTEQPGKVKTKTFEAPTFTEMAEQKTSGCKAPVKIEEKEKEAQEGKEDADAATHQIVETEHSKNEITQMTEDDQYERILRNLREAYRNLSDKRRLKEIDEGKIQLSFEEQQELAEHRELLEEVDDQKYGYGRKLRIRPRKLKEINENLHQKREMSRRLDANTIDVTTLLSVVAAKDATKQSFEEGMTLEGLDVVEKGIVELSKSLADQTDKVGGILMGKQHDSSVNYLNPADNTHANAPSAAMLQDHDQLDEYHALTGIENTCNMAMEAINRTSTMLDQLEKDHRNITKFPSSDANNYYRADYKPPTTKVQNSTGDPNPEGLSFEDDKNIAKCLADLYALPEPGYPDSTSFCFEDFYEMKLDTDEGSTEESIVEDWTALTEMSGAAEDVKGCVEKSKFEEPVGGFSTGEEPPQAPTGTSAPVEGGGRRLLQGASQDVVGDVGGTMNNNMPQPACYLEDTEVAHEVPMRFRRNLSGRRTRQKKANIVHTGSLVNWRKLEEMQKRSLAMDNSGGTMDTIVPISEVGTSLELLEVGHPMSSAADCGFLKSGCMPWQLSFENFKTIVKDTVAEGSHNAEGFGFQASDALEAMSDDALLGDSTGSGDMSSSTIRARKLTKIAHRAMDDYFSGRYGKKMKNDAGEYLNKKGRRLADSIIKLPDGGASIPMTDSTKAQFKNALEMSNKERRADCREDEICDPSQSDAAISDDDLSEVFNMLDTSRSGCLSPPIPETYDCDAFGESDLTMIHDPDDKGLLAFEQMMGLSSMNQASTATVDGELTQADLDELNDDPDFFGTGEKDKDFKFTERVDWSSLCRTAKKRDMNQRKIDEFRANKTEEVASKAASAILRQRLRQRRILSSSLESTYIHPKIRQLARLPIAYYSPHGRRMTQEGHFLEDLHEDLIDAARRELEEEDGLVMGETLRRHLLENHKIGILNLKEDGELKRQLATSMADAAKVENTYDEDDILDKVEIQSKIDTYLDDPKTTCQEMMNLFIFPGLSHEAKSDIKDTYEACEYTKKKKKKELKNNSTAAIEFFGEFPNTKDVEALAGTTSTRRQRRLNRHVRRLNKRRSDRRILTEESHRFGGVISKKARKGRLLQAQLVESQDAEKKRRLAKFKSGRRLDASDLAGMTGEEAEDMLESYDMVMESIEYLAEEFPTNSTDHINLFQACQKIPEQRDYAEVQALDSLGNPMYPNEKSKDGTMTGGKGMKTDIDGDGVYDEDEFAKCAMAAIEYSLDIPMDTTNSMKNMAQGQGNFKDMMSEINPNSTNATHKAELKEHLAELPSKCYAECQEKDPMMRKTEECRDQEQCEFLFEHGDPMSLMLGKQEHKSDRIRRMIRVRRERLMRRRRALEAKRRKLASSDCLEINGEKFCHTGKTMGEKGDLSEEQIRRLDAFEIRGIKYLWNTRPHTKHRYLKMKKGLHRKLAEKVLVKRGGHLRSRGRGKNQRKLRAKHAKIAKFTRLAKKLSRRSRR